MYWSGFLVVFLFDFHGRVRQLEYRSLQISGRVCIKVLLGVFLIFDGMVLANLKNKHRTSPVFTLQLLAAVGNSEQFVHLF